MKTYTTRVTVPADRRITVELPEDMPEGEAEVTVSADGAWEEKEETSGPTFSGTGADLLAWLREDRAKYPRTWTPRSKEEVDADIRALRDEWDR